MEVSTRFSPAQGLLLVLESVEGFVLVIKFARVGEGFGISLGIDVAIGAGLLGRFGVFRLAERDRGAKQETAQQDNSGQSKLEMGHDASGKKAAIPSPWAEFVICSYFSLN
jgi:hypothetical protein